MKPELKLTPTQRKEVYLRAIKAIKAMRIGSYMGLCWTISGVVCDLKYGDNDSSEYDEIAYGTNMKHNFPEVYKYKPVKREWHNYHYWFPCNEQGMQKRVEVLEKAIIKVEKLEKLCNLLSS